MTQRARRWLRGLFLAFFILILAALAALSFGDGAVKVAEPYLRRTLTSVPLNLDWARLGGNLLRGYQMENALLRSADGTEAFSARQVQAKIVGFSGRRPKLDLHLTGLVLDSGGLMKVLVELPKSDGPSGPLPVVFSNLILQDARGSDLPWRLDQARLWNQDGIYHLEGAGTWNGGTFTVAGTLGDDLKNPQLDLNLHGLDGEGQVTGSLDEGFQFSGTGFRIEKGAALSPLVQQWGAAGTLDFDGQVKLSPLSGQVNVKADHLRALDTDWGRLSARVDVTPEEVTLSDLSGLLLGGRLNAAGKMGLSADHPVHLEASLDSFATSSLGSRVKVAGGQVAELKKVGVGLKNFRLRLDGPLQALNGWAKVQGLKVDWRGLTADGVTSAVNWKDGLMTGWVSGRVLKGGLKGHVQLNPAGQDDGMEADLSLDRVDLSGLDALFPDFRMGGLATGKAVAKGDPKNPFVTADLTVQALRFQDVVLDRLVLQGQGTQELFHVKPLSGQVFGGTLTGEATLKNLNSRVEGDFDVKISNPTKEGLTRGLPQASVTACRKGAVIQARGHFSPAEGLSGQGWFSVPGAEAHGLSVEDLKGHLSLAGTLLTLSDFRGKIYGAPLKAEGTIHLADGGSLDVTADLAGLDLKQWNPQLSGLVEGHVQVSGPFAAPRIDGRAAVPLLAYGATSFSDVRATVFGAGTYDLSVTAKGDGQAALSGGGTVVLPRDGDGGSVDFVLTGQKIDLGSLLMGLGGSVKAQGLIDASLTVKGALLNPDARLSVTSPQIAAGPAVFPEVQGEAWMKDHKIQAQLQTRFGGKPLRGRAEVDLAKGMAATFEVRGQDVPLSALSSDMPLSGRVTLRAKGRYDDKGLTAGLFLRSPSLTLSDFTLKNVELPLSVDQNQLLMEGGVATFLDAPVTVWAKGNLSTLDFEFGGDSAGISVTKLVAPFKLPAKAQGTLDLSLKGTAHKSYRMMADVKCQINGRDIIISDVPYMKLVTGGEALKIRTALLTVAANPDEVYLVPGSALSAWPDDPVFKYVTVSGPVWRKPLLKFADMPKEIRDEKRDPLKLAVEGNINLKALNSLLGGIGVMVNTVANEGLALDPRQLASDVIGGMFGNAKDQFRDVSFTVGGTYDDPRIDDLHVQNEITFDRPGNWSYGSQKLQERIKQNVENRYTLKFKLPVGPGEGKGKSITSQAGSQILGQIINSLVPEDW